MALVELRICGQEKLHYTGESMHKLVEIKYYVYDFLDVLM